MTESTRIINKRAIVLAAVILFFCCSLAFADTIYLRNGRGIQGLVKSETTEKVELEVGFGVVTFKRDEVFRIDRSPVEQASQIRKKWQEDKIEADKRDKIRKEELEKAKESGRIEFRSQEGSIVVDAFINNKAHAFLLLDTGASLTVISDKIAKQLGINTDKLKEGLQLQLADGRKLVAKLVVLNSVKIKNVEVQEVVAAILPDPAAGDGAMKDGLLGMSFLKYFNFTIDHQNNKLILDKINK
ncbi:MAG: retropepsin-like aspartic protease [Candidatus Omnitrophota bacterium]|jgi:clan AA aspartic protease (TIGR02281 family)